MAPTPHERTLDGLRAARDAKNADDWLTWGAGYHRTPLQKRDHETAHAIALERIAISQGPAAPPMVQNDPLAIEDNIPF